MPLVHVAGGPTPSQRGLSDPALCGPAANQCAVPAKDRVDCGYPEVTPEQCNNRGCCFDSSIPGVPWCFKPLQEAGEPWEATHTWALGGPPLCHSCLLGKGGLPRWHQW